MSAEIIRLADRGRPYRIHSVNWNAEWFEDELKKALERARFTNPVSLNNDSGAAV